MDQDNNTASPIPLSVDERQLIELYRRCTERRRIVIMRFAKKLAVLEWPLVNLTNVLPFKRRKDD